jgi:predicted ATPase/DNA-binding SARP family transcriptional activator
MLRLYLLGPLRLIDGDTPLDLATPPKTLQLLAYLLLHRKQSFTRDQLAFTLWPDRTEAAARGQLRRYLYRLRQFLPDGVWLTMHGDQVQWNLATDYWLDVEEFEGLSGGQPDQLEAALSIYSGDLLVDFYEDWVIVEREQLRDLYLADLQHLLEYYRERQDYQRALGFAQQILRREPLHENILRESMRLRAAAGNRTGALEEYRQFRQRVVEELGVAPLPETTALYETLRHSTSAPTPLKARPLKIPVPLTPLLGRQRELAAVCDFLLAFPASTRLLTLTGPGGAGKTRLAHEVAQELARQAHVFRDGIFYVSLSSLTSAQFVLPALAKVLEIPETGQRSLLEAMQEMLHDKNILLILDNFEHVLEAAPLITDCLTAATHLRVLVTSREALHLSGEHEFEVPPLPLPDLAHLPPLDQLLNYAAMALFVERAQAVQADFALSADNAAAVAEICVRLDGLPLAIELAAARSKLFTPQAMLQRLSARLRFLVGQTRDLPQRQRTLRGVIDWSYNLLSAAEQRLFDRLSVFAGSFTVHAVAALGLVQPEHGDAAPTAALDQLAILIDKNMLRAVKVERPTAEPRFRLLLTLREYAQERLVARGEFEAVHEQHARYRLQLAEQGAREISGPQQAEWLWRFEAARDNFRAALSWLLNGRQPEQGLQLAVALGKYWALHGDWLEGTQWLKRALAQNPQAEPLWRARALSIASELADKLGDGAEADQLADESLTLFRTIGETRGLADALCSLASARLTQSDYARAERLLQEALALCRQIEYMPGAATALSYLGMTAKEQGDFARAVACHEESLEINRRAGNIFGIVQDLAQLSFNAYWQGQYARSAELAQRSLDAARRVNNRRSIAVALDGVGAALGQLGRYDEAQPWLEESLALYRELGNKSGQATVLVDLAQLAGRRSELDQARQLYREALTLAWAVGDRRRIAFCLEGLSAVTTRVDPVNAVYWLSAAQALRAAIHSPLPPSDEELYVQTLAQLRANLQPLEFEAAWQRGQAAALSDAAGSALQHSFQPQ